MVTYNPRDWFKLILSFHKSDTFRMLLPAIATLALYSAAIVYLEKDYFKLDIKGAITAHSILGFVISLMLVFRTNTAYDRWWEGRKLWGSFVNHSRSLSMKLSSFAGAENCIRAHALIVNYIMASKNHLRNRMTTAEWMEIPGDDFALYTNESHIPNALLASLFREVKDLHRNKHITDADMIMMETELRSFAEILGACERIRTTPIPYSYSMFIKKVIFFYTLTLPFALITDFGYWSVLIVPFIFYAFASLELLAEEIEDPFGEDANDLPLDDISRRIKVTTGQIFRFGKP